jgi:hypothetical protein
MIPGLLITLALLSQVPQEARILTALEFSAYAWGHDPALLKGLAYVESTMQANPPRHGRNGKRWGDGPGRARWRYCGLMQTRHYPGVTAGPDSVPFPPGELLVAFPELSAWYGAIHLAGWRSWCGRRLQFEAYNKGWKGCRGETEGTFTKAVKRAARRLAREGR